MHPLMLAPFCIAVQGCGATATVEPLPDDSSVRGRAGATHSAWVDAVNIDPFALSSAERAVRRAAKKVCGLSSLPSSEAIQLEGGFGLSVLFFSAGAFSFKCPESREVIQ